MVVPVPILNKNKIIRRGLVAEYKFNEGAGTFLKDWSGYGNDGVIDGATWTSQGLYCVTNDKINLGDVLTGLTPFTICVVANLPDPGGGNPNPIIGDFYYDNAGDKQGFRLDLSGSGYIRSSVVITGGSVTSTGDVDLRNTNYYHLTVVYTPSKSLELFTNGISSVITTSSIPATYPISTHGGINIGYYYANGNYYGKGTISQVLIYNRALSSSEIYHNYNSAKVSLSNRGIRL